MKRNAGTGAMSKSIGNNLLLATVPLLLVEGRMIYPVFCNGFPLWQLLAPVSLLTLSPTWGVWDFMETGWYGGLLTFIILDIAFLSVMAFSINRNHKIIEGLCLCVFIFFSMAAWRVGKTVLGALAFPVVVAILILTDCDGCGGGFGHPFAIK